MENTLENRIIEPKEQCHSAKETEHDLQELNPNRDYYHLYTRLYAEALQLQQ